VFEGILGECGHRGGYFEYRNVPRDVGDEITKMQSVNLCANSVGQIVTYLMVKPPEEGEPSHALYCKERDGILDALRQKAKNCCRRSQRSGRDSVHIVAGAMYAFPQIQIPEGRTDDEYCMALLQKTGICLVPGSGFGQVRERRISGRRSCRRWTRWSRWCGVSTIFIGPTGNL